MIHGSVNAATIAHLLTKNSLLILCHKLTYNFTQLMQANSDINHCTWLQTYHFPVMTSLYNSVVGNAKPGTQNLLLLAHKKVEQNQRLQTRWKGEKQPHATF